MWLKFVLNLMKRLLISITIIGFLGILGCRKSDNLNDNLSTITQPYVLLGGKFAGGVGKSNDGKNFDEWLGNGSAFSSGILFADSNIIHLKNDLFVGKVTNAFYAATKVTTFVPFVNSTKPELPSTDNTLLYDDKFKCIYVCGKTTCYQSLDFGKTWAPVGLPSTKPITGVVRTNNGQIFFLTDDNFIYRNFTGDPKAPQFRLFANLNTGGFTPAGTKWILGNFKDQIVLCDGAKKTVSKMFPNLADSTIRTVLTGAPVGKTIMSQFVDCNNNFYMSLDSVGLYKLNGTSYQKIEGGLPSQNLRVWDIVCKTNVYRSGESKTSFFCATNFGLYKSENNGTDWQLANSDYFSALY